MVPEWSLERLCCEDEELFYQCAVLFLWGLNLNVHFNDFLSLVPSRRILVHKLDPHAVSVSPCFHQGQFRRLCPEFCADVMLQAATSVISLAWFLHEGY